MKPPDDYGIIGEAPAIRELRALIVRVAPMDIPVLVQGPTGAGKELVAQALHAASGRAGRCVAVNVCAIPNTMFEAALFGHVRGAFTGAATDARGYFEEADRGSLFLDEIGGLPLTLQASLLRAVETGEFRPIGARADRRSTFRVIAATNEPLGALVEGARFRRDLAHRLSGIIIDVPPLRNRLEDIPALAGHFIRRAGARQPGAGLTAGAIHVLQSHAWPGNIRELRHTIERALALADRPPLDRDDILRALRPDLPNTSRAADRPDDFARRRLTRVLEHYRWDTARAADHLGVHRATVYRRMRRLGISVPSRMPASRPRNGTAAEHPPEQSTV